MTIAQLRNRYLATLGLSGFALTACSANEGGATPVTTALNPTDTLPTPATVSPPVATATPSVSVAPSATPLPSSTATLVSSAVASWTPTVLPKPVHTGPTKQPPLNLPSCPNGKYCISEANAGGPEMSPAPYAHCAVAAPLPAGVTGSASRFDEAQTKLERTAKKDACCYEWYELCSGGRPLLVDGEPRVAPLERSRAWLANAEAPSADDLARSFEPLDGDVRQALFSHYAREAGFEHASVASFARVSLALLSVGAPADLVRDAHRAALDEIEHAAVMYRLASACAGAPVGPGALSLVGTPPIASTIASVVEEALFEGCMGEVVAALVLREEAERAVADPVREMLTRMASDEERHAELAWRTLAWAMTWHGEEARPVLERALDIVADEITTRNSEDDGQALVRYVATQQERASIRRGALSEIVMPCLEAMLASESVLRTADAAIESVVVPA